MEWKLSYVLITSLLSISVIGCWPFVPPPPPPPPAPMHLFEDHYVRYQGPYDRGLNHMGSHASAQIMQPLSPQHMNPHLFYPMPSMEPIPAMSYDAPQERLFNRNNDFDFGNTQEYAGYHNVPREPTMMKVRHMNYRYRKRLKTQRPIEGKAFSQQKEVKYSQSFNAQPQPQAQPRRFNVIDSRGDYQKKIPNSVNDKIGGNQQKVLAEEESNPQNSSLNKIEKIDIKSETKPKDLEEKGSQSTDILDPMKHPIDMPIEVTTYAMKAPDGAVTQVTEMLYDVENNPFKTPTTTQHTPFLAPVWRPSTPITRTVTVNPFVTQTPYLSSAFSETDIGSTFKSQPINTAVTAQFNDVTMSPMLSFSIQRSTMEPISTVFTPEDASIPPTRLKSPFSASDYYSRRARKKSSTQKPFTTTAREYGREPKPGLSGAAIAGIVIGSMVSIMLLAGTSLFVMYRNPFSRSMRPQRGVDSLPNVISSDNSAPRVHRWQPRRLRRL